jgi:carbonic anhydrase
MRMNGVHGWSRRQFLVGATAVAAGVGWREASAEEKPATAAPLTPEDAVERLRAGNARFAAGTPESPQRDLAHLRSVAPEQTPFSAVLGCADSRVPIELLYDQGFGDMFVVRVAGNVVASAEIASLEYGTRVLGAKVLVVLGHSNCGTVKAAMQGGKVPGQISALYHMISPALKPTMSLDEAVVTNVRYQARKLQRGSTVVGRLIEEHKLALVGGVFDLETGTVKAVEL